MHFGGTYIVARAAGFSMAEAHTIANAAQYVDDAANTGFVRFDNGALFQRTATVHTLTSPSNADQCSNHLVWLPFHFLPGNSGLAAEQGKNGKHSDRLVCQPNSPVAQDMIADCFTHRDLPQALHRLGITAHVFLDTYAHQHFSGFIDKCNWVGDIESDDKDIHASFLTKLENCYTELLNKPEPMLGHGMAQSYPDLPWLKWSYIDGHENKITRNNFDIFSEALNELCCVFQRYRKVEAVGLPEAVSRPLHDNFVLITDAEADVRLDKWLKLIEQNAFGFGAEKANYDAKEWRTNILGQETPFSTSDVFENIKEIPYPDGFMSSDWKLFHDAAKDHRYAIVQRILPHYGLCAA